LDVLITSISIDSRRIERGALFACLRGLRDDGHAHAAGAVAAGASAVLAERELDIGTVPLVVVPSVLAALSPIAAQLWANPSHVLTCVGVTGTNGKTTTTHIVETIARSAGRPFGLIGTLGARLNDKFSVDLEHTTPYAHDLQALLARFRAAGAAGAVLEVSSHALAMHRVDDVEFDVVALTNITHDHLDFHGNFEEYARTKRRLFELAQANRAKRPAACVLNLDDAEGRRLAAELPSALTYGVNSSDATLRAVDVELFADGSRFLVPALRPAPFTMRLPGPFNVANAMAAIAIATALDIDVEAIADGLLSTATVPGRMTQVPAERIGVYVDYAHTPDGLRNVLQAARALTQHRVLCVFGCGGDRDPLKRPVMGRIARELADHVVLTSDNPRFEDPQSIIADVLAGMGGDGATYTVMPDRAAAIENAIALAEPGDVVVIAGKGHEAYQLVRGERLPFSDVTTAQAAIRKVGA
jgi:UDP-N-acetylmuramoyl-L-alanyl-D-glutamate--2,6-diaminopimelate ligase